jgi:hypothetical protein
MSQEAAQADAAESTPAGEMTNEEKKFLMLALWDALVVPKWTKDDLIDFGKAIFSKRSLKELSEKEWSTIFPHLRDVVAALGKSLVERSDANAAAAATDAAEAEASASAAAADVEASKAAKVSNDETKSSTEVVG